MPDSDKLLQRIGVISDLVERSPRGIGRTSLMKCLYFLQVVRDVPLGYRFRLYIYGPFDPDVLNDLSLAERLGAVESKLQYYPGGYGYELNRGTAAPRVAKVAHEFLARYQDDIDWVVQMFGARSALDLETASTLVFVDRSVLERPEVSLREIVQKVHEVKPHLTIGAIEREARRLKEQGLIKAA
jgi:hypothetical protein